MHNKVNSISLIICTYNPAVDVFARCLESILMANHRENVLETIIIDNNSDNGFKEEDYFKNFCAAQRPQLFIEIKPGLTPARLRGIKEAKGKVLLFVDDDNILNVDFLERGSIIADAYPYLGAWSGKVILKFEVEPTSDLRPYLGLLVSREINADYWSNLPHLAETMPCGAGLFVRKEVADYYLHLHETGKRNIQLDRTGLSLFSGGDNDLAACACDVGLGVGVFHSIVLTHDIPAFRVKENYMLQLAEGIAASTVVLQSFRGVRPEPRTMKNRVADWIRLMLKSKTDRKFYSAVLSGREKGAKILAQNPRQTNSID